MKLTNNLKIYIVLNVLSTLAFAYCLANDIGIKHTEPNTFETSLPFIYALFWLVSTLVLLKLDKPRNSRLNLGLQYHVAATVITAVALIVSAILFEEFRNLANLLPAPALAVSLFIHWFFTRKDPKGIEAKKVFK